LICCEVFVREIARLVAESPHTVDMEFVEKGLHDRGAAGMRTVLQGMIDTAARGPYDAVLMGYGLCNGGMAGLRANRVPLVIPRAHDCISILMGSATHHAEYHRAHPGTYYLSPGWIERSDTTSQPGAPRDAAFGMERARMVELYGEDNADYLISVASAGESHYNRIVYIASAPDPGGRFEREAVARAHQRGWEFQRLDGSTRMLAALINGPWTAPDFVVVRPGEESAASYDDTVLTARPVR
jgi:hypothetical protein